MASAKQSDKARPGMSKLHRPKAAKADPAKSCP
jgi:hypothetical protein